MEVVAGGEPYISHWLRSGDLCPRDEENPLFGVKCGGGQGESFSYYSSRARMLTDI